MKIQIDDKYYVSHDPSFLNQLLFSLFKIDILKN